MSSLPNHSFIPVAQLRHFQISNITLPSLPIGISRFPLLPFVPIPRRTRESASEPPPIVLRGAIQEESRKPGPCCDSGSPFKHPTSFQQLPQLRGSGSQQVLLWDNIPGKLPSEEGWSTTPTRHPLDPLVPHSFSFHPNHRETIANSQRKTNRSVIRHRSTQSWNKDKSRVYFDGERLNTEKKARIQKIETKV